MVATFDYTRTRAVADRFIGKFGQSGVLRQYEPVEDAPGIPHDYPCSLVIVEYTERERAGTLIEEKDRKAIVAAGGLAVVPASGDELIVGADTSTLISVKPLSPGGTDILYECQIRQ